MHSMHAFIPVSRHFLDKLKTLRSFLNSERYRVIWAVVFCLFLCSVFVTDNVRMHRNIYYWLVIPVFLLQVRASFFSALFRSTVFQVTLIYLLYLWISLLWSSEPTIYTLYNEARTLVLMLVFMAITAFYFFKLERFTLVLAKCFALVVGATAIISLIWYYSAHSFAQWGDLASRAVAIGLLTYPLDSAVAYGFVAVFLTFSFFPTRRGNTVSPWPAGASLAAIFTFVCMTQTRGVILSIAVIILLGLAWQRNKRFVLALAALGAITLAMVLLTRYHPGGMIGEERSIAVRWEIWQAAVDVARERIWFGFGLNEHQKLYLTNFPGCMELGYEGVAHSVYLENLIFGGLVGTLLLFLLLGAALRQAWSAFSRCGEFLLPAIILFPILSGVSTGFLTLSKIAPEWIHFWLPLGILMGSEVRQKCAASLDMSVKTTGK